MSTFRQNQSHTILIPILVITHDHIISFGILLLPTEQKVDLTSIDQTDID